MKPGHLLVAMLVAVLFIAPNRAVSQSTTAEPSAPLIHDQQGRIDLIRKGIDQSIAALDKNLATPGARIESRHFALYAHFVLLLEQDPAKAEAALKRLLNLQDNNPNSKNYGEFGAVEGAATDDTGAVTEYTVLPLVQIMLRYREKLSPELQEQLIERLTAALKVIQRANRDPDLSSVFLMNAVDELLIGELLRDPKAITGGTAKLLQFQGVMRSRGIQEYTSSNQTAMQLLSLLVGQNYTRQPEARRLLDPIVKFLWCQVAANVVPGRGSLGGPQSRCTDFIYGIGAIDSLTFVEGMRDGAPYVTPFGDGLRAVVNMMEGGWRPDDSVRKLALGERVVRQRWGGSPGMDRYFYVTDDYALGSSSAPASFYDRKLTAEFTTPRFLPAIWVVPDPFDAPYGQIRDKKTNQIRHPQHFVEAIAAVQEKNSLLAIMNLRKDVAGKVVPSVATNVVFPAAIDEVLLDGKRVPMDKAFEMPVTTDATLILREGTGAIAIRLFHIDGMNGEAPVMQLKFDANQWGVARLVGYHYRGNPNSPPEMRRPPMPDQNIRAGVMMLADRVAGPEDLQKFIARVSATKIEQSGDNTAWRAKLTDGERNLEVGLNLNTGSIVTRKVNGQEYQPVVFRVNDRDLALELLGVLMRDDQATKFAVEREVAPLDYEIPRPRQHRLRNWLLIGGLIVVVFLVFTSFFAVVRSQRAAELARARAQMAAAAAMANYQRTISLASAATKPSPGAVPVAAIWTEDAGPRDWPRSDRLIVGVWSDGTIVWRVVGDKDISYRFAKVSKERVDQLLRDLDAAGFFGSFERTQFWGPDAGYMVIAGKFGEKQQWFGSWHDSPTTRQANPNVVVTETGIYALQPGQPLPRPSAEYQRFVDAWTRARVLIEAIVPAEGEPIDALDPATFQSAFPQK